MLQEGVCFGNVNTEFYLEEIEHLEKGGTQFMNAEPENKRQSIIASFPQVPLRQGACSF